MDDLAKFRRFFRHRAKKIISEADRNKLILPWRENDDIQSKSQELADKSEGKPKITLTPREEEVAGLICEGMTAKESAEVLCITQKTIEKQGPRLRRDTFLA